MDDLFEAVEMDGTQMVSARKLHEALEIKTRFRDWFGNIVKKYGLVENKDFYSGLDESTGGRPEKDYLVSASIARELAIRSNSEQGERIRNYFVRLEKAWNTPEMIRQRAMQVSSVKEVEITREALKERNRTDKALWKELAKIGKGAKPGKGFVDAVKNYRHAVYAVSGAGFSISIGYDMAQRAIGILQDMLGLDNEALKGLIFGLREKIGWRAWEGIRGYLAREDGYVADKKVLAALANMPVPGNRQITA